MCLVILSFLSPVYFPGLVFSFHRQGGKQGEGKYRNGGKDKITKSSLESSFFSFYWDFPGKSREIQKKEEISGKRGKNHDFARIFPDFHEKDGKSRENRTKRRIFVFFSVFFPISSIKSRNLTKKDEKPRNREKNA